MTVTTLQLSGQSQKTWLLACLAEIPSVYRSNNEKIDYRNGNEFAIHTEQYLIVGSRGLH